MEWLLMAGYVKQGDLLGDESLAGVIVLVVAMKFRNGNGAKEHRKVDT